ncbi:hypothetical protein LPJ73_004088 [Coemansia sp. RSA 2703]|nr:hypothetical protein LPJ73_004088 [Coemansia sp. RSA 2703]
MPIIEWTDNAQTEEAISVVESAYSAESSDETQISLFTGAKSGGAVYRMSFDISGSSDAAISSQRMNTPHRKPVTALCHMQALNMVISGNVAGDISLSNQDTGRCVNSLSLGEGETVDNINCCPFDRQLFMVSGRHPMDAILLFDCRKLNRNMPDLVLQDTASLAPLRYNYPAWHSSSGLICAPARRYAAGRETAAVNMWDPRFVNETVASYFTLHKDDSNVTSVDFTEATRDKGPLMITASDNTIGFTSFSIGRT